jgi:hypothetical protein
MVMQNNDDRIWLVTSYSGLIQEEDDTGVRSEGTIEIKSLDIMKQYLGKNRKLIIAVKITDKKWNPIALAEVGLFIAQEQDNSISLYKYTDSDGVALFELHVPKSGILNAGVTSIRHPCYTSDNTKLQDKWRTIRV